MKTNYEVVKNIRTINMFAKMGLLNPCDQTGTKIKGLYGGKSFTCTYIWDVPKPFEYKGFMYREKYFSGCFYPYLVRTKIN